VPKADIASGLFAPLAWHGQDQPRHLCRLIHLDEVPSTPDKEQFRLWKELMERSRYNWQTGKWGWGEPPKDGQSRY
jgi:hypothetical protein